MKYKNILITGGCGFVGSNLAQKIKKDYPEVNIIAFDNLYRRGSEINAQRLQKNGINFVKGDVRKKDDFLFNQRIDLIIECAAEPSVMAGTKDNSKYVVDTNLVGTLNCLEFARSNASAIIFLSTSRVYPILELKNIPLIESEGRFEIDINNSMQGVSSFGISENFPLGKIRTLYGSTKLASEFIIQEYSENYGINSVINRCGVIAGPWQFGKVDQGVISLWVARHLYGNKDLSFIGFGGKGKQVRDCLHINDFYEALKLQFDRLSQWKGDIFNIGGGIKSSISLQELTTLCQEISGKTIKIDRVLEDRPGDIPLYISDFRKFSSLTGWSPRLGPRDIIEDIFVWMKGYYRELQSILS